MVVRWLALIFVELARVVGEVKLLAGDIAGGWAGGDDVGGGVDRAVAACRDDKNQTPTTKISNGALARSLAHSSAIDARSPRNPTIALAG